MGNTVLVVTSLAYQTTAKSSNRSGYPKKFVIFDMSESQPAYPALDMHENEDEEDKSLVRETRENTRSNKGVTKPLMTKTLHLWFLRDLLRM